MCVVCPGLVTLIIPAHMQVSLQVLSSEGMLPSNTVVAPGVQGAGVLGMHGMGVSVPMAAAVADATVGLATCRRAGCSPWACDP
jgi:hypothetical protein